MNRRAFVVLLFSATVGYPFAWAEEPQANANAQIVVYLSGEVKQRGRQVLPKDATILDAFAATGGGNGNDNLRRVCIHRRSADGVQRSIHSRLDKILKGEVPATVLHNGDAIMIEARKAGF